ncbi:MAG TPA: peptidase S8, partial [Actinoallomurus sp.]
MRRVIVIAACAVVTAALAVPARAGSTSTAKSLGKATEYVVLYKDGVSPEQAHAAVKAAGGTIVRENRDVGLATVR